LAEIEVSVSDFVSLKNGVDVVWILSFNGGCSLDFSAVIFELLTGAGRSETIVGWGVRTGGLITCGTCEADAYKMK